MKEATIQHRGMPFPRSYWVIPGKLMAGCYPGADNKEQAQLKLQGLLNAGIRHVINLMEPTETNWDGKPFASYEATMKALADNMDLTVTFSRMPITDMSIPSRAHMTSILDQMDECIQNNRPTYIHCWGGRGRTGTVVGCYLSRHGYAKSLKALDLINALRRNTQDHDKASPETSEQASMVLGWQE